MAEKWQNKGLLVSRKFDWWISDGNRRVQPFSWKSPLSCQTLKSALIYSRIILPTENLTQPQQNFLELYNKQMCLVNTHGFESLPPQMETVTDKSCPAYWAKCVFGNLLSEENDKKDFINMKNSQKRKLDRAEKKK